MAKKSIKQVVGTPKGECRDCCHHSDPYNIGHDGTPILCKCSIKQLSVFMGGYCEKFEKLTL